MLRKDFDAGATPRQNFLTKLRKDAAKYKALGIKEQVMFSFTTDVYNPFDTSITRPAIEIFIEHGLAFCVLTKAGTRAWCDHDLYRPDRDAFASTLTSLDERFSRKWERSAAPPSDRIDALKAFHERGIFTWVSLEPTLDVEASLAIVEATHNFVDLYKVGRVNYLPMTKTTDWRDYTLRMLDTLNRVEARHYIKKDLQLPSTWLSESAACATTPSESIGVPTVQSAAANSRCCTTHGINPRRRATKSNLESFRMTTLRPAVFYCGNLACCRVRG